MLPIAIQKSRSGVDNACYLVYFPLFLKKKKEGSLSIKYGCSLFFYSPVDTARVRLMSTQPDQDYINASFVDVSISVIFQSSQSV